VQLFLTKNVCRLGDHDPDTFRRDKLYNQEVDTVLHDNFQMLDSLFKSCTISGRTYITCEDFAGIFEKRGLVNEQLNKDLIRQLCIQSQMTSVNEMQHTLPHKKVHYPDFLEAIARCCDEVDLPTTTDRLGDVVPVSEDRRLLHEKLPFMMELLRKPAIYEIGAGQQRRGSDDGGRRRGSTVHHDSSQLKSGEASPRGQTSRSSSVSYDASA
jgi:hypothetical protein